MSKNELILIPPGAFIMGSDVESFYGTIVSCSVHAKPDEAPIQAVYLDAYCIDKYPVTFFLLFLLIKLFFLKEKFGY
jgi:formylglycine-generating enzyme required for sulfatase activity